MSEPSRVQYSFVHFFMCLFILSECMFVKVWLPVGGGGGKPERERAREKRRERDNTSEAAGLSRRFLNFDGLAQLLPVREREREKTPLAL